MGCGCSNEHRSPLGPADARAVGIRVASLSLMLFRRQGWPGQGRFAQPSLSQTAMKGRDMSDDASMTTKIRQRHPDTKRIPRSIRYTDDEWAVVERKAEAAGTSAPHYVRCLSLEQSLVVDAAPTSHAQDKRLNINLDVVAIVNQLSAQGNALNQIARVANIKGFIDPKISQTLEEVRATIRQIRDAL